MVLKKEEADTGLESSSRVRRQLPVPPPKVVYYSLSRPCAVSSMPVSSWAASVFLSLPT